jgi:hypothetical protein
MRVTLAAVASYYFGMKVLTAVAALTSIVVLVAAGGSSPRTSAPLRHRLAAAARRLAQAMGDPRPARTVRVYGPASYSTALAAFGGGVTSPDPRKGRYYVIVVRGHFVFDGAFRATSGTVARRLWSPTRGDSGLGLGNKLPSSMSRLGRPTLIRLR